MTSNHDLPDPPRIDIRPAGVSDLRSLARVHTAAFPGFFLTQLGPLFLQKYYATILEHQGGILLVAERDGRIAGFVAGFVDPVSFYRGMAKRKWRFLFPIAVGVLRNPRLLSRVLGNSRRVMRPEPPQDRPSETSCELSSVAVDPAESSRGIGRQLVARFLDRTSCKGARCVFLTTDAAENDRVNAFYLKCGFRLHGTLEADGGRPMNQYLLEFPETQPPCPAARSQASH